MKATGLVRKIDELGRIVIPIELRRALGIDNKDSIEILVEGESVILKRYEPACSFCGNKNNVQHFRGKIVCSECTADMFKNIKAI